MQRSVCELLVTNMVRTPLWKSIATALQGDIAAGHYQPGDKLPTEADLATRFGVNRHTVRHALKSLAEAGLVYARRGSGVFVSADVTEYPIGKRVRFHQNLRAAGRTPAKTVLALQQRVASAEEAEALSIAKTDMVLEYLGLSLSDDVPIAVFSSVFPVDRLPGLEQQLRQDSSVTKALLAVGVSDYTRINTRLTAVAADATQALHLRLREGAPLLRSQGVNAAHGQAIEYGTTWFAGDRTALVLGDEH